MKTRIPFLLASLLVVPAVICATEIMPGEMAGYLFGPAEKVPEEFNAGFSLYAVAWPLVETYPGHRFQTGLCGTWMHPQYEADKKPEGKCYTDVEGGLGWWRDTHFPTTTPKFIMGGVGPNFRWIANGPGYGAGTWEEPRGQYGVAQLSPWLLFPLTAYKEAALWDDVQRWFDGGAPATGLIKTEASAVHTFGKGGGSSWSI